MLDLVKPSETIAKALRRLGGNKGKPLSSSQRWKAKKQKKEETEEDKKAAKDKENFLVLTELADKVLSTGYMEVYEMTHEKLNFEIKKSEKPSERLTIPEGTDDDDALDMFADDFDKKEATKIEKDFNDADLKDKGAGDGQEGKKTQENKGYTWNPSNFAFLKLLFKVSWIYVVPATNFWIELPKYSTLIGWCESIQIALSPEFGKKKKDCCIFAKQPVCLISNLKMFVKFLWRRLWKV